VRTSQKFSVPLHGAGRHDRCQKTPPIVTTRRSDLRNRAQMSRRQPCAVEMRNDAPGEGRRRHHASQHSFAIESGVVQPCPVAAADITWFQGARGGLVQREMAPGQAQTPVNCGAATEHESEVRSMSTNRGRKQNESQACHNRQHAVFATSEFARVCRTRSRRIRCKSRRTTAPARPKRPRPKMQTQTKPAPRGHRNPRRVIRTTGSATKKRY